MTLKPLLVLNKRALTIAERERLQDDGFKITFPRGYGEIYERSAKLIRDKVSHERSHPKPS